MVISKKVKGEILKLKRATEPLFIICVFVVFFLLMFFQKAFNSESGYYTPELLSIQYMTSFNLLLLSLVGFIPGAVLGACISGIDYKHNTNVYVIVNVGRIQSVFIKIKTLFLGTMCLVLFMTFLGVLEGLFVGNQRAFYMDWKTLFLQLICCYSILLCSSMVGFLGATLTKRVYGGILIAIVFPILLERISIYIPILKYFTLNEYYASLIGYSFKNMTSDPQVQFSHSTWISYGSSVLIITAIILSMLIIHIIIVVKRDFKA
ncbi:hypothetical protein [Peribacillus sp. SI8-4]|uniref:hypothetical protein n=1 Tax=Peribacillus sp. SI8-4 TaxID=3048009 RepID=UPI00255408DC|nr:hypothetical protein [Peribacillus sp. SI8-4]